MRSRLVFVLPFIAAFAAGAVLLSVNAGAQPADDDRPAMDAAGPMDRDGPMGMDHQISPEDRQAFLAWNTEPNIEVKPRQRIVRHR